MNNEIIPDDPMPTRDADSTPLPKERLESVSGGVINDDPPSSGNGIVDGGCIGGGFGGFGGGTGGGGGAGGSW